jgi:hypothetical protein
MRRRVAVALHILCCALPSAVLAAPAAPAGKIVPADIQSTFFTGKPFTSATPQNIKYKMVFSPDGTMTREPLGKTGVKGDGTWKLSKDGFCTTWKGSPSNCFTLISAGDNKWSVLKGTGIIGTWSK